METNYLRADPFRVTVVDTDFGTGILDPLFARGKAWAERERKASRWGKYGDGWITLDHLEKYQSKHSGKEHWVGTFFRAKTDDLPSKVTNDGISPLDIEEHEGVGQHVAFVWDVDKQIIWMQRDRQVGHFVLMQHLRERTNITVAIVPIYGEDAPAKAKKMGVINTVEFAYEVGNDPNADFGPLGFLNSFKAFGFGRIEVKMTRVRKGSLKPPARALVGNLAEFVEQESDHVTKAKVSGQFTAQQASELVDMIKDRVDYKGKIAKTKMRNAERLMAVARQIFLANHTKVK